HPDLPSFPTRRSSDLGLALEVERNAGEQFRLLLCGFKFGGRFFRERSANAFERIHVACCSFNREAARQQIVARVAWLYRHHVARSEEHTSELQSPCNL